jgi:hypothetical protein
LVVIASIDHCRMCIHPTTLLPLVAYIGTKTSNIHK